MTARKALLLGDGRDRTQFAAELTTAGYDVVQCAPSSGLPFPCVGIEGTCPLDATVGVAVVVHDEPTHDFEPGEIGVICALRDGVPLVLAGRGSASAFGELVDAVAAGRGDVVAACERAVTRNLRRLGRDVGADLERDGDTVRATLPAEATDADAVRAHHHLRRSFPAARTLDVSRGGG